MSAAAGRRRAPPAPCRPAPRSSPPRGGSATPAAAASRAETPRRRRPPARAPAASGCPGPAAPPSAASRPRRPSACRCPAPAAPTSAPTETTGTENRSPGALRFRLGPAGARRPGQVHPVEVEVHPRDRRVVARVLRLRRRRSRATVRQRAVGDEEPSRHPAHACGTQRRRHLAHRVGVEQRIAGARQHQVAPHHAALDRTGGDQSGAEAEVPAPARRARRAR